MKQQILGVFFSLLCLNAIGQFDKTGPTFMLGAQGVSNISSGDLGIGGSIKALFPTSKNSYYPPNNWVIAGKLYQIKGPDGKLFSAFDKTGSNLSILSVMAGYRIEIGSPIYNHFIYESGSAFYIEGLVGGALIGTNKKSPTIGGEVGLYVSKRFNINASLQFLKDVDDGDIIVAGLGASLTL